MNSGGTHNKLVIVSVRACWLILITSRWCNDFAVTGQCAREPGIIPPLHSFTPSLVISLASASFSVVTCIHRLPNFRSRLSDRCLSVFSLCLFQQHFKLLVDELHVKGEGRVKNAMKESFKILNEVCANQVLGLENIQHCKQWKHIICVCLGCSAGPGQPV